MPSVLFVLSSHSELGDTGKKTGWYLPEAAHPYHVLSPVANITFASPAGGEAPLDPASVEAFTDTQSVAFKNSDVWKNTVKLSSVNAKDFDAIFYVGGHGPMFDLATLSESHALIKSFVEADKIVAAVCHGPAAIAKVKLADGSYLVKGQDVTGFSNDEEDAMNLSKAMPFMLETVLRENGAEFTKADKPFGVKVVVSKSGKLITGQNPASATETGEAIKKALGL